jgi:hypothetical protein
MTSHELQDGPPRIYAYASPHYAFVFPKNKVVVYNTETRMVVFSEFFDEREHRFTSMIIINTTIYIGLDDGRLLRLKRSSGGNEYRHDVLSSESWCDTEGLLESNEKVSFLLGGNERIMFARTTLNNIVVLRTEPAGTTYVPFGHEIKVHTFDSRRNRLLLVSNVTGSTVLSVVRQSKQNPTAAERKDIGLLQVSQDSNWKPLAVSKNRDVFIVNRDRFYIVKPGNRSFVLGSALESNDHVQCCFAGKGDKYLAYCGGSKSQLAVVKHTDGRWIPRAFLAADTDGLFGTGLFDMTVSDIRDPATDGEKLVVRVGPDHYSWAENEYSGKQNPPSLLWTFDLNRKRPLKLYL